MQSLLLATSNPSIEEGLDAVLHLRRRADQKTFTALCVNDQGALFYFSILVGEKLSFDSAGLAAYLLGKFFVGPADATTPV